MGYFFFIFFILTLFAIRLCAELNESEIKGWLGEGFVTRKLNNLDQEHYRVLKNLMLPSAGNSTNTQIDHVVVSNYGIFIVETKAYRGWIFGNANYNYWTQVIYKSKHKFYNPMRQNFAHKKAVESLLSQKLKTPVISFVAFPNAGKLKIQGTSSVGYVRDVIRRIKEYTNAVYSDQERDEIFNLLFNANITDKKMRQDHVKEILTLKARKKRS